MRIFHDTWDIIQFVLYLLGSRFLASVFDRNPPVKNPPGDYESTLPPLPWDYQSLSQETSHSPWIC